MVPTERKAALLANLATYFTGKPCKYGHTSERRTATGFCVECSRISDRKKYQEIRGKVLAARKVKNATPAEKAKRLVYRCKNRARDSAAGKARYAANIDRERARSHTKYVNNREKALESGARWRDENREHHRARCREWQRNNPAKSLANANRRRARKLQAMPTWVDSAAIDQIYAEAKRLEKADGITRHVDHVVPLKHDLVCGLHVPANLQILPAVENMRKGNRYHVL